MCRLVGLRLALVFCLAMAANGPQHAQAGAWPQQEGRGIIIFTNGQRTSAPGSLIGGATEGDLTVSQIYGEYGVLDGFTLGLSAYAEYNFADATSGSAAAAVLLRKRIWQNDRGSIASAQLAYSVPIESALNDNFGASKPDSVPEVQFRGLFGQSWWGDWGNAFLSSETGYHLRSESAPDELRFDMTVGYEPFRCCMAIVSAFSAVPLGNRDGFDNQATLKIAPSLAYTLWPEIGRNAKKPEGPVLPASIQVGLEYDLLDTDDGLGFFVSIWRRF